MQVSINTKAYIYFRHIISKYTYTVIYVPDNNEIGALKNTLYYLMFNVLDYFSGIVTIRIVISEYSRNIYYIKVYY